MGLFVLVTLITISSTGISDTLTNASGGPPLLGVFQGIIVALPDPAHLPLWLREAPANQPR